MNKYEALQATMSEVKENLKMAFVLGKAGHEPALQDTDGKLHYHSPFRHDDRPSFDVFSHLIKGRDKPEERYGDFADPNLNQGDVIDLVGKLEALTPPLALARSRELLAEQIEEEWQGPVVRPAEHHALDLDRVQSLREQARSLAQSQTWHSLFRTHPGLTDVVLPSDRVFLHPTSDTIVFLLLDDGGEVRGVRFRDSDGRKFSVKGSRNILMRLEDPSGKPVFLAEGETDLWAAYGALHDEYEVVGVPGVGSTPERAGAASLAGRTVFIAFDPDDAGERGRKTWANYLDGIGCDVRTVILPDGKDLAKLHAEQIRKLPGRARSMPPAPDKLVRFQGVFASVATHRGEQTFDPKSNWEFTPEKILIGEDGARSYQGVLSVTGQTVVLPDTALVTQNTLTSWGRQHQAYWYGNTSHVQQLAGLLAHEAAFLPEGRLHDQVGLYEGSFVFPGGYIGSQPVEYTPTVADVRMGEHEIFLRDAPVDRVAVFEALYGLQSPAATGPMLAWLAAAPLRTRMNWDREWQFPILNISGVSGSGKSALTTQFLRAFTSTYISSTLSSTSVYAIESLIDSSNGFPIWFDEYRPGAKAQTKDALDQLIRDAYNQKISTKGGRDASNLSKLGNIRTNAPLIVSGEDSFTETSHIERMVLVRLRRSEQGDLGALERVDFRGFGHAYLRYLTSPDPFDFDPTPPAMQVWHPDTSRFADVEERQRINYAVLDFGWRLLERFLMLQDPTYDMPELDLSAVIEAGAEANAVDPTMELLQVLLDNDTRTHAVWWGEDHEYLAVHPANVIKEAREHPSIVLPFSNSRALTAYLKDKFGLDDAERTYTPATKFAAASRLRAYRIPADVIGWDYGPGDDQE